jgi:hypothetical protein
MNPLRGVVLLIAGCLSLYESWKLWKLHAVPYTLFAFVLGVLAIALGIWRITRLLDRPRP